MRTPLARLLAILVLGGTAILAAANDENTNTPHTTDAPSDQGKLSLEELQIFADVFHQIRSGYVEEVDDSTLFEYAVRGMLEGLDPHSVYLTKEDYNDLQTSTEGEFSGLGIEIGRRGSYIEIIAPIDGSPAVEAGLEAGDIILKLDDEPVKGMSINDAVERMRGPIGSSIKLQIGRPGNPEPFDVSVVRDTIKVGSVRSRQLSPGLGYLRIAQFQRHTGDESRGALDNLTQDGELKGLVIDLRNNPGGVLGASVDVADLFLDGGLVVYTEGRHPSAGETYNAEPGDALNGAPVVVLINSGSASASEIVAGALQDRGRAVVMGTRSFGKGSVQTVLPVSENRAVKLTTARYFTPNGRSIQAEGIVPDIVVERAQVTSVEGQRISEADLKGRLDAAEDGSEQDFSPESDRLADLRENDNQLYEALTLLRGINLLARRQSGSDIGADTSAQSDGTISPRPNADTDTDTDTQ